MPVRAETRARARALQLQDAGDVGGGAAPRERDAARPRDDALWSRLASLVGARPRTEDRALTLAGAVVERRAEVDERIARASDRWRLDRLGAVDRNILRLASAELLEAVTPPKVVIDEAVRLAHWFGGPRSPAFVNGVLDRIARDLGRL